MSERVVLTISQVIADLENGLTRKEISQKYGLNMSQVKKLFNNPKLKGRKSSKIMFELVDDLEESVTQDTASQQEEYHTGTVLEEAPRSDEGSDLDIDVTRESQEVPEQQEEASDVNESLGWR